MPDFRFVAFTLLRALLNVIIMRRILTFPILFFVFFPITIAFLDPSLPLDIQSTEQDLQPVNLATVVKNKPQLCSGESPLLNVVSKRQTTDDQLVKLSQPFGNQEESLEVPVNPDPESHENFPSEENNDWDNFPLNVATTNIFSTSFNEQDTPDQMEAGNSNIRTDNAFEIAATSKHSPTFEQDPITGFVLIRAFFGLSEC